MSAYFAMRCMDKYDAEGLASAQAYYLAVFSRPAYQTYKTGCDDILTAEGHADIIVPIP